MGIRMENLYGSLTPAQNAGIRDFRKSLTPPVAAPPRGLGRRGPGGGLISSRRLRAGPAVHRMNRAAGSCNHAAKTGGWRGRYVSSLPNFPAHPTNKKGWRAIKIGRFRTVAARAAFGAGTPEAGIRTLLQKLAKGDVRLASGAGEACRNYNLIAKCSIDCNWL